MDSKEQFLFGDYIPLLKKLGGHEKGNWGVLSAQGMIEHMTNSIGEAWGRIPRTLVTPPEQLEGYRQFMFSEREFRPNTKNALMGETADPLRHGHIGEAIAELEQELARMRAYHQSHPGASFMNPFFGELNYSQWLHLVHKHAVHHLKQFSLL